MAEAEDVITDVARHATIYARELWRRQRGPIHTPPPVELSDVAERLDLLIGAAFGSSYPLRAAQTPAIPSLLLRIFRRHDMPQGRTPLPATDGACLWLPPDVQTTDLNLAMQRYRAMALRLAMLARRNSAAKAASISCPRTRGVYLLLEGMASDEAIASLLPGSRDSLNALRLWCLAGRPDAHRVPPACRALEQLVQTVLQAPVGQPVPGLPWCRDAQASAASAALIAESLQAQEATQSKPHTHALYKDYWTGDLLPPAAPEAVEIQPGPDDAEQAERPRSARMPRRPKERQAQPDEDDRPQGVWMVQTGPPLEQAEDPMGMQRPADRDEDTSAEEFADAVSELPEARLVSTPGKAREVLLSDDPPDKRSRLQQQASAKAGLELRYPEWDYRQQGYRHPGATVHLTPAIHGPQAWIDDTLARHRALLDTIRKRFEMLQAERLWLRRRLDGDDIDLDACLDAFTDVRAGLPMPQALYKQQRPQARDLAIVLLIDISGSTDSWLTANKRIIDVEREALLLVSIALEKMGAPYCIQAFSGEGPRGVTVNIVKDFDEAYGGEVALRIAGLEPQYYTRAGAALRHASATLMQQNAQHRLLLLLSDGKPNDVDEYEGQYGVQDMRRAVDEAKRQGIFPFCLTIDRQAASYLPAIFGARQYALLHKPEALPTVLLDWMRRLLSV
ncbi:VWA domain-containing protein [Alcaligenaceae bacterium]|nr:VWA domain-containing protein [Alcaligenaceae bacterium]